MSIDEVYDSRHGRLHIMSLVSSKSNIESILLVAAILHYVNITLLHVKAMIISDSSVNPTHTHA